MNAAAGWLAPTVGAQVAVAGKRARAGCGAGVGRVQERGEGRPSGPAWKERERERVDD